MRSLHVRIVFQSLNNPLFEGLLYWKINLSHFFLNLLRISAPFISGGQSKYGMMVQFLSQDGELCHPELMKGINCIGVLLKRFPMGWNSIQL